MEMAKKKERLSDSTTLVTPDTNEGCRAVASSDNLSEGKDSTSEADAQEGGGKSVVAVKEKPKKGNDDRPDGPTGGKGKPKGGKGGKADGGSKPSERKIDDVGEHIAGARKDALAKLSQSVADVTLESLIGLPASKAFKRPDLKKAVKEGALRETDARFAEAVMAAYLGTAKPKLKEGYKRASSEKAVWVWAEHAKEGVDILARLFSLDEAEKRNKMWRLIDRTTAMFTGKTEKEAREARRKEMQKITAERKEMYDRVLSGNFDEVTLRLINNYIANVTPRNREWRPLSKRLPQEVERGLRKGERASYVDALFSRICESAVPKNERAGAEGKRRIEEKKKELLKKWAIATGNWHTSVSDFTDAKEPLSIGKDSDVYISKDGKHIIKVSKGKDSLKKFRPDIDAVALFNHVFPNSRYEILGYGEVDGQHAAVSPRPCGG